MTIEPVPTRMLAEVPLGRLDPTRFEALETPERRRELRAAIASSRHAFRDRTIWNVNSTAHGGGVAEMLNSLLAYARGAGIDARWLVIRGDPDFFRVTKRIHNRLHGAPDGGELGEAERAVYERTLARNAAELDELVGEQDVVMLHDPQTAGLIPALERRGRRVVWRCHIGVDVPNDIVRQTWAFLLDYVRQADVCVFSRAQYAWEGLLPDRIWIVAPSIDAFSPKNADLGPDQVHGILAAAGLVEGEGNPTFTRGDGSPGKVERAAELYPAGPVPAGVPTVVQVSRWDKLKDPLGVLRGFVDHVAPRTPAHLVLAGPAAEAVTDDPEGAQVLAQAVDLWRSLPPEAQARVHLAGLPMADPEENAAIVNALQRHAAVAVQKSLAEGFGLTVAEAMWKSRPVVASRVGGIQDQIEPGRSGILLDDPRDLAEYGERVVELLGDPAGAARMGEAARRRVRSGFLDDRHLIQYAGLLAGLV